MSEKKKKKDLQNNQTTNTYQNKYKKVKAYKQIWRNSRVLVLRHLREGG